MDSENSNSNSAAASAAAAASDEVDMDAMIDKAVAEAPDPAQPRKRPGRPRKRNTNIPLKVSGIADKPIIEDNVMELTYENPKLFKKIFGLFKGYNVNDVVMVFSPTELRIYAEDHPQKSHQYTTIFGTMMNHYYSKDTYKCCVKRDEMERKFRAFDKNHVRISIILREDDHRSKIHVTVKDNEMDKDNHITIELKQKVINLDTFNHDETNYPLSFVLPSKHFKREIASIGTDSSILTIQKNGSNPLSINYEGAQNRTNFDGSYNNPEKIQLKSKISDDDILSVSVSIQQIKPFSNSAIGDNVKVCVDKFKPICLITEIDKRKIDLPDGTVKEGYACVVKTFSTIKSYGVTINNKK